MNLGHGASLGIETAYVSMGNQTLRLYPKLSHSEVRDCMTST
jgi:hypothetical protein